MIGDPVPPPPRGDGPPPKRRLPFSGWLPFAAGVAAGIVLRLVFWGRPGSPFATMTGSFIYLAPVLVGAVTVYVAERSERRSWRYYLWAPFLANVLFVLGTLLIMIEGLICAIVIVPLFSVMGCLGGLLMGAVCRLTNWPRRTLYSLWALPLLVGAVEAQIPVAERIRAVERTIVIQAPAERIWREIHAAKDIQPWELQRAWLFRIGVPLPHEGVSREVAGERLRTISMGKQVRFDQVVTDWRENRLVRWQHRYQDDSFPAYALDDHVRLGGHYFDIHSTGYELRPLARGTELRVRMEYRVSTSFNWYADRVAMLLLENFEHVLLDFYRRRSELPPANEGARP
jgi:hypothetical protein